MSTEEKPEEKFKILINIGVGLSILLFVGIIITIVFAKTNAKEKPDEYAMQRLRDSVDAANAVVDPYGYNYDYYSDPGDYYTYGPGPKERESDSLNREIKNQYGYSTQQDLLAHLDDESDRCAGLIRKLIDAFEDTLHKSGVSQTASTSIDFFQRTQQDEQLFSELFKYRETTEDLAPDAGMYDCTSFRTYFPLLEKSEYSYIKSWDPAEFEKSPKEVITYLENMEIDLRCYENQVLWDMMY
jgi:hypothetical protein